MKVYINHNFASEALGGAHTFIRALRDEFSRRGASAEDPAEADIVLCNAYHNLDNLISLRRAHPDLPVVMRVDGPIRLHVSPWDQRDQLIYSIYRALATGVIFQSDWSKRRSEDLGFRIHGPVAVIMNSPDARFNSNYPPRQWGAKPRIVATSWSPNVKKGFTTYQWLDENLDFSRWEFVFVGNTPFRFRNIRAFEPMKSPELAAFLRTCDLYITASHSESCSNALIEAIHTGLPAVARRDGGNPEILGPKGRLFGKDEEIPGIFEQIRLGCPTLPLSHDLPFLGATAAKYLDFLESVLDRIARGTAVVPKYHRAEERSIRGRLLIQKIQADLAWKLGKAKPLLPWGR